MWEAVLWASVAGFAIPVGALVGAIESVRSVARRSSLDHGVTAFGGGILIAAVALILLPDGAEGRGVGFLVAGFGGGALATLLIDRAVEQSEGSIANVIAMLMDFVPESIALGAVFALGGEGGPFLAVLIALQNLPEGFNAFHDLEAKEGRGRAFALLAPLALLGPLAAWAGVTFLASSPEAVSFLFLFAAGGIVYLVFHDIAPQALQRGHWLPTAGAVIGVLVGLVGDALLNG